MPARDIAVQIRKSLYNELFDTPPQFPPPADTQMFTMLVGVCLPGQRSSVSTILKRIRKKEVLVKREMDGTS